MPLPKSHNHVVGVPVVRSEKRIKRGEQPCVLSAVKFAASCPFADGENIAAPVATNKYKKFI